LAFCFIVFEEVAILEKRQTPQKIPSAFSQNVCSENR